MGLDQITSLVCLSLLTSKQRLDQLGGRSYSDCPSLVGPQPLCNRTFFGVVCCHFALLSFCWCRDFCHRTESDRFLFLFLGHVLHKERSANRSRGTRGVPPCSSIHHENQKSITAGINECLSVWYRHWKYSDGKTSFSFCCETALLKLVLLRNNWP